MPTSHTHKHTQTASLTFIPTLNSWPIHLKAQSTLVISALLSLLATWPSFDWQTLVFFMLRANEALTSSTEALSFVVLHWLLSLMCDCSFGFRESNWFSTVSLVSAERCREHSIIEPWQAECASLTPRLLYTVGLWNVLTASVAAKTGTSGRTTGGTHGSCRQVLSTRCGLKGRSWNAEATLYWGTSYLKTRLLLAGPTARRLSCRQDTPHCDRHRKRK